MLWLIQKTGQAHFAKEVPSVLNIREVQEVASERNLNWVKFYMEFADRLLEHKSDRRKLVAKVRDVCNNLDHNYLDRSGTADGGTERRHARHLSFHHYRDL